MSGLPPNVYARTPGARRTSHVLDVLHEPIKPHAPSPDEPLFVDEEKKDLPSLIAYFGTSESTVWLEKRYKIWRGEGSTIDEPKIQGYLASGSFVFCWGNPICVNKREVQKELAEELVAWAKKNHKHPVWCVVDTQFAEILADGIQGVGWSTLSCIQEDVLHTNHFEIDNKDLKHNIRRAEKASVNVEELRLWAPTYLPEEKSKKEIEEGLLAWEKSRKGKKGGKIAAASLLPWLDASSRRYWVARTPKEIVGLVILTPIHNNQYQIKNAIAFPNSPNGTSELMLSRVIQEMKDEGKEGLTWGASATSELITERNIGGWRIKMLSKGYNGIIKRTGLAARGQFRAKFDTEAEALHVSFPPGGFGWRGLVALMGMLKA